MKKNKIILGSAISIAALAVAIDHTRHKVPEPLPTEQGMVMTESEEDDSPCGMGVDESPCGMGEDESPCGMNYDESPCGMGEDESPCGMGETPCGM
ncbi:hypothetical protein [Kaarinaea lacus]